jgi:hypothetical protein
MARVVSGVASRTSMLPDDRSSASAVDEVTLTISRPIETMNPETPGAIWGSAKTARAVKLAETKA